MEEISEQMGSKKNLFTQTLNKNAEQGTSPNSLWRARKSKFYDNYNLNLESKFTLP